MHDRQRTIHREWLTSEQVKRTKAKYPMVTLN